MRKSFKLLAAVALAGAAFAGASAFTASNTFSQSTNLAGYGEITTSGAAISAVADTPVTLDQSKLDFVTFTSSTDLTNKTATMTLKSSSGTIGIYNCDAWDSTTTSVTCHTAVPKSGLANPPISVITTTGLTVV